jgi:hydrogenase expression/formation protein HypC
MAFYGLSLTTPQQRSGGSAGATDLIDSQAFKELPMCLAIPGKVLEEFEQRGMRMAKVQFGGIVREASLDYVPAAKVGDYVLVHVGFAISTVDADEAARTYELLEQMDQLTELDAPVVEELPARKPQ